MKHLFSFLLAFIMFNPLFAKPTMITDSCALSIDYIVNYDCSNSDSTVALFAVDVINPCSSQYQIFQNNSLLGTYDYSGISDTVLIANNFGANEIIVCDIESQLCCDTININTSCTCAIYEMDYSVVGCVDSTNMYSVSIDMDYVMASDSFELGGGGASFGNFAYSDLPVSIGPFSTLEGGFEVAAFDLLDPFCFDFIQIDSIINCPVNCAIENLFAEASACDENDEVFFDFEFDMGNQTGQFLVMIDSVIIDTLAYGSASYTSGPIDYNCDLFSLLTVVHIDDFSCGDDFLFPEIICCDPIPDCAIETFVVNPSDCDSNGNFDISFSLEYADGNSDSFLLELNDNVLEQYAYGDTLYTFENLPGDCETEYKFILRDLLDESCISNFALLGTVCCEPDSCIINDFFVEAGECDDNGNFSVDFEFNAVNTVSDSFVFEVNGELSDTLLYGETFYTVGPLDGDCNIIYEFLVYDLGNPNCIAFFAFDEPVCCDVDECSIQNIQANIGECSTDGNFLVDFTFDVESPASEFFSIQGPNINVDTFLYGESVYTVGPFVGDCSTIYEFIIADGADGACMDTITFEEPICCDSLVCSITDLIFEIEECEEGEFFVDFEFNVENSISNFFYFTVNGNIFETYEYGETFYTAGPFEGDCTTLYEFQIIDTEIESCLSTISLTEPICCEAFCTIEDIAATIDCLEDEYLVVFNFIHSGTSDLFDVYNMNTFIGSYMYADLPVTIGPFADDGSIIMDTFLIVDASETCEIELVIEGESCNPDSTNDFGETEGFSVVGNQLLFNSDNSNDQIKLFDVHSRLIMDKRTVDQSIDLSLIPAGVYLIQMRSGNEIKTRLFFKN